MKRGKETRESQKEIVKFLPNSVILLEVPQNMKKIINKNNAKLAI